MGTLSTIEFIIKKETSTKIKSSSSHSVGPHRLSRTENGPCKGSTKVRETDVNRVVQDVLPVFFSSTSLSLLESERFLVFFRFYFLCTRRRRRKSPKSLTFSPSEEDWRIGKWISQWPSLNFSLIYLGLFFFVFVFLMLGFTSWVIFWPEHRLWWSRLWNSWGFIGFFDVGLAQNAFLCCEEEADVVNLAEVIEAVQMCLNKLCCFNAAYSKVWRFHFSFIWFWLHKFSLLLFMCFLYVVLLRWTFFNFELFHVLIGDLIPLWWVFFL